jgi:SARP family transcriptional regulator, regulator of embCAB operon
MLFVAVLAPAMAEGAHLGFAVLGPVQMTVNGVPVKLGTPKQRAVLATLIINRNHPVGFDTLVTDAWEDRPPRNPAASVHTYIAELRKLIKDAGLDPMGVVANVAPGYRLTVADLSCDVDRFAAKHSAGVAAASQGRFEQARMHLRAALDEWKGPVLTDLRDLHFAQVFAAALDRTRLTAIDHWAEAEIACGRAHDVLAELEALVAQHPYEEPLWAQLITALYLTDRQIEALAACRRQRQVLDDDLGLTPGQRIQDLEERVLRQQPLEVKRAAQGAAIETLTLTSQPAFGAKGPVVAYLVETATSVRHPLTSGVTKIGRLDENDIVLADVDVSRHHGAIVDTRTSYLMVDMHSRNGIEVDGQRITTTAILADGSRITIGKHRFTFEIRAQQVAG